MTSFFCPKKFSSFVGTTIFECGLWENIPLALNVFFFFNHSNLSASKKLIKIQSPP
jgi:hypothetical protein